MPGRDDALRRNDVLGLEHGVFKVVIFIADIDLDKGLAAAAGSVRNACHMASRDTRGHTAAGHAHTLQGHWTSTRLHTDAAKGTPRFTLHLR